MLSNSDAADIGNRFVMVPWVSADDRRFCVSRPHCWTPSNDCKNVFEIFSSSLVEPLGTIFNHYLNIIILFIICTMLSFFYQ